MFINFLLFIVQWLPQYGRAPGGTYFIYIYIYFFDHSCDKLFINLLIIIIADDDGSGTVTILEAFRTLVNGQFKPDRPVEFHWYSAEEAGLLGSQAIALEYEKEGKDVVGMLQVFKDLYG